MILLYVSFSYEGGHACTVGLRGSPKDYQPFTERAHMLE